MKKRILALFAAVTLLSALLPAAALAATPVAQIGSVTYNTLADAFAAASLGDKVELLTDITGADNITVPAGVVLDLNHFNITTTGVFANEGAIVLHQENAAQLNHLLCDVQGNFATNEAVNFPNDAAPDYSVPASTFILSRVNDTAPKTHFLSLALGEAPLIWNADVPAGMQLRALYALTLGGDIAAAADSDIGATQVETLRLTLSDSITVGSNNAGDGDAVLLVESIYDDLFGDDIGEFHANGNTITLQRTGKMVITPDIGFDESVLLSGLADKVIGKTLNDDGTVTYYLADPAIPDTIPTFRVTFEMNGFGQQVPTQTLWYGSHANRPADPAAEGQVFHGWFADAACTVPFDFNAPITADTTVYAGWTQAAPMAVAVPKTGDADHLCAALLLMAAAAAGLCVSLLCRKQRANAR